ARHADDPASRLTRQLVDRLGETRLVARRDADVDALPRELARDRLADAAAPAGDDRALPVQLEVHDPHPTTPTAEPHGRPPPVGAPRGAPYPGVMTGPTIDALVAAKTSLGTTVSVCLPARNEEATVGQIVASVRRNLVQRVPLVDEVVVIDDGS